MQPSEPNNGLLQGYCRGDLNPAAAEPLSVIQERERLDPGGCVCERCGRWTSVPTWVHWGTRLALVGPICAQRLRRPRRSGGPDG
jgi:hypothetical protein